MKIVLTPDWFLGSDVLIESFSFIILILFFYFSVKSYKLSKNKKSLYLGIGFLLIAIAEIATILTKFVLYYDTTFTHSIGTMIVTYQIVKSVNIFYYIGFSFHRLLTLLGLYIIYRLPMKKKTFGDIVLALCFIVISAFFSNFFYYIFHITALVLLILIINNYFVIYKNNKAENTKILIIAFSILALSQINFILSKVGGLYVVGQLLQLVSYIILLFLIIRIFKHGGKKKKQDRYNIRYVGDYKRKRRKN